jgi:hypothetical protein
LRAKQKKIRKFVNPSSVGFLYIVLVFWWPRWWEEEQRLQKLRKKQDGETLSEDDEEESKKWKDWKGRSRGRKNQELGKTFFDKDVVDKYYEIKEVMDKRLEENVDVVKDGRQEKVPNKTLVQWNNWWKGRMEARKTAVRKRIMEKDTRKRKSTDNDGGESNKISGRRFLEGL